MKLNGFSGAPPLTAMQYLCKVLAIDLIIQSLQGRHPPCGQESCSTHRLNIGVARFTNRRIEEEASKQNQAIEIGRGGRRRALSRTGTGTGAAKIRKQGYPVLSDRCDRICTQKIEVETYKNNLAIEIGREEH